MQRAELERSLIVSAMTDNAVMGYLRSRMTAQDFGDMQCRNAWVMLAAGKTPPDRVAQEFGGVPVLTVREAVDAVKQVKTAAALRTVQQICMQALKGLQNGGARNPERFIAEFSRAAARVSLPTAADQVVKSPQEWMEGAYQEIEARRREGRPRWFELGLSELSKALALEPGHLAILAAETGKGKTALALNIAAKLGVEQGIPVLYVNTEMGWEELAFRLYALMAGVNLFNLRAGKSSDLEMRRLEKVRKSKQVGNALYVTDALPWASAGDVASLAREYAVTVGLKVLVVDYVQRLETNSDEEQWQVLLTAAKEFKSLAQELGIMVLLIAQLNDRQQLAGSKGMMREADAVVLLEEVEPQERIGKALTHRLKVVKSRHTAGGVTIEVILQPGTLKVFEVDRDAKENAREEGLEEGLNEDRDVGDEIVDNVLDFLPEDWRAEVSGVKN